jgi:hypothetical protein
MERILSWIPKTGQRAVVVSGAILLISLLASSLGVYVTLAAPLNSPYVPTSVAFQGQLMEANGNIVPDGTYPLTFTLYDQATGGNALWTETQSVPAIRGVYNVQLGSQQGLPPNAFDGARWLGVKVGNSSSPEMTPRIPISAVPFALNAHETQGLQGYPVSLVAPLQGQVLTFDASANNWAPATIATTAPSVRAYSSVAISTSNNIWKTLAFNSERWDTANLHDNATNNTRLTAPQAGKYFIFGTVEFAANNTVGTQRYMEIVWTSGGVSSVIAYEDRDGDLNSIPTRMSLATVYSLAAADYVELSVKQNRGGTLNITTSANYTPEFGMIRIDD